MLKSETIIKEMGVQDLWHTTLKDKLTPYGFGTVEIQDFIKYGTPDKYENHMRHALGMITTRGWKPRPVRSIRKIKKEMPKDAVRLDAVKGIEHGNYKGVKKPKKILSDAEQFNADIIKETVKALGGAIRVSEVIGCNRSTVWKWSKPSKHGVYIPKKYLELIRDFAFESALDIPYLDLLDMIPTK